MDENEREVRAGTLSCSNCGREFGIQKGIVTFLDGSNETISREINGWHELAGELPERLILTMTALPYYPHVPWPHTAPDFFQLFEEVDFSGKKVVDIGAGRTWSTRFLATLGRASEVVAVDVLTRRFIGLETADIFFEEDGTFFERLCADLHKIPLPDGWTDVVFSCASIHHSSDPAALFREVWRLLSPGGTFVFVSEPCKKASIPDRQPKNVETAHGINEHIYSYAEYVRPLRRQGFHVRHLAPRSIAYRLLYPDSEFLSGLPAPMRRLATTHIGRRAFLRLVGGRWAGPVIYRYANLPLSLVCQKPAAV